MRKKNNLDRFRERFSSIRRKNKSLIELELESGKYYLLAFQLEGKGLPVIHGIKYNNEKLEFASVGTKDGKLKIERDILGTRPVYISEDVISSDFRVFDSSYELIDSGLLRRLDELKKSKEGKKSDDEEIIRKLAEALTNSIYKRVKGLRKVSVAFSGGLDSSIIAFIASKYSHVELVSVCTPNSSDKNQAVISAKSLGLELHQIEVGKEQVIERARKVKLPFAASAMDTALFIIYNLCAEKSAELECERILLGQGADELFCGYMKYLKILNAGGEKELERINSEDILKLSTHGFIRDEIACSEFCIPSFPYSDKSVFEISVKIPHSLKVREGSRKYVLRKVAEFLGIPKGICNIPKKAAQYSSGIEKLLIG